MSEEMPEHEGSMQSQIIEGVADQEALRRLAHRVTSGAAAVFLEEQDEAGDDERWYTVVTEHSEVYRTNPGASECDCGKAAKYSPRPGTPAKTAQKRRSDSRCIHGAMASSAQDIGACPDCGAWALASEELFERGELRMIRLYCAVCGCDRKAL